MTEKASKQEFGFLEMWRAVWRSRFWIGLATVLAALAAFIYSLVAPKVYVAKATILSPDLTVFTGTQGAAGGLASLLGRENPATSVVLALLKSETMAKAVVKKFDLMKVYEAKTLEDAIRGLKGATNFKLSRENAVTISVEAGSPELAAEMANFYVSNLEAMNAELQITSTKPMVVPFDPASPPEKKTRPKVVVNTVVAFFGTLALGVFFVVGREKLREL
jgi:uncharacterized protein involved in exopolysaccharide biosynthesis